IAYASSMMTGNFFDIVFDGQSAFAHDAQPTDRPLHFIGQDGDLGWLEIGPWVADGGTADRAALRATGQALVKSDAYLETVLGQDLALLPDDGPRDPDTDGVTVVWSENGVVRSDAGPIGGVSARMPSVSGAVVAWQEGGRIQVRRRGGPVADLGQGFFPRV